MTPRHDPPPLRPPSAPQVAFWGGISTHIFPVEPRTSALSPVTAWARMLAPGGDAAAVGCSRNNPPQKKTTLGRKPPSWCCLRGDPPPVQGSECPPPPFGAEGGGGGRDRSRQLANPAPAPSGSLLGQEPGSEPRTSSSPLNWIRFLAAGSGCRKPCPGAGEEGPHSGEEETHEISWFHSPQQAAGAFFHPTPFSFSLPVVVFHGESKKIKKIKK